MNKYDEICNTISNLLHHVGLPPRVYYTLTYFRRGGGTLGSPLNIVVTSKQLGLGRIQYSIFNEMTSINTPTSLFFAV